MLRITMPVRFSRSTQLSIAAGCLAAVSPLVYAQAPLQLNVPYSCQDGWTRTITRCEKNARAEVCFFREEQKGQVVERYMVREQMDGWLATCKVPPAPAASPAPAAPPAAAPASRPGGALNPAYLAGMPSVDTVKREIRGSNAVDTLARQVAVLNTLPRVIQRMRMAPGRPYATTADEQQRLNAYAQASYELSQSYLNSAGPDASKAFLQTVGRLELDPALNDQMYALLSPATMAEFWLARRKKRSALTRAPPKKPSPTSRRLPAVLSPLLRMPPWKRHGQDFVPRPTTAFLISARSLALPTASWPRDTSAAGSFSLQQPPL